MDTKYDCLQLLEHKAYKLRLGSLCSTTAAGSGHVTSCLSAADLVAALFFYGMKFDPKAYNNQKNDTFILSKGHAAPLLYAAWWQAGVLSEQQLVTLRQFDSALEGHPTPRFDHVTVATGSLGCGLAIGLGQVLAARRLGIDRRTYVLMGDGECAEGSVWEAAQLTSHYQANNVVAVVDCNRLGQTGETLYGHDTAQLAVKFKAFGWNVIECDGHAMSEIICALDSAQASTIVPTAIIAYTYKGKGLLQAQDKNGLHGKAFSLDELPALEQELAATYAQTVQYTGLQWQPTYTFEGADVYYEQAVSDLPEPTYAEPIATRKAAAQALVELGKVNEQVIVFDAEVKNSTYTQLFEEQFPDRFIQSFIAEQTMVGMACGVATSRLSPFVVTFGAFFTRAHDQLRMAAISKLPLRVIGTHVGVSIGQDGPSQMALEDIALFRSLPDAIVLSVSDAVSAYRAVELLASYTQGIAYLRVMRQETPCLYPNNEQFRIGGCKVLRSHPKATALVVATGAAVHESLMAADILQAQGVLISVIDAYSVKPLDVHTIVALAQSSHNRIITVEDHYQEGGLGEAVTHAVSAHGIAVTILAVKQVPRSGRPEELRAWLHIDCKAIIQAVKKMQ